MKKKIIRIALYVIISLLIPITIFEIIPDIKEKKLKNRVFTDMESKSSEPIRAIVGIIPESEKDGLASRNGIGSGVIFEKKR